MSFLKQGITKSCVTTTQLTHTFIFFMEPQHIDWQAAKAGLYVGQASSMYTFMTAS